MLCTFDQFDEHQHGRDAGGKGKTLAQLYQSGHPVPNGCIILAPAFDEVGLRQSLRENVLTSYHQLIAANANGEVAVRSSGLAEDSAVASFAGEFETGRDGEI